MGSPARFMTTSGRTLGSSGIVIGFSDEIFFFPARQELLNQNIILKIEQSNPSGHLLLVLVDYSHNDSQENERRQGWNLADATVQLLNTNIPATS